MKTILLIGLGRFGRHIAMKLNELNHQVMVVDKDESRVDAVLPFVTNAQIPGDRLSPKGTGGQKGDRPGGAGCAGEIPAAQRSR